MICKKCGSQLNENDKFCKNCGETVNSQNNNFDSNQSMNNYNNGQSTWENYNNNPMYNNQNQNKSGGNGKYIAIGLAIVVVIFAIIFGINMYFGKDSKNTNNSGGSSSNTGVTTTSSSKNNYKVLLDGFNFEIPDNMIYEKVYENEAGSLSIADEEQTWNASFGVSQQSFSSVKEKTSSLQSYFQQKGFEASAASEKTIGGVEFITIEVSSSGQNVIIAYAKLNSMYLTYITAVNLDNEFDYKILEKLATIIKSAEYVGSTTNNIENSIDIDMNILLESIK